MFFFPSRLFVRLKGCCLFVNVNIVTMYYLSERKAQLWQIMWCQVINIQKRKSCAFFFEKEFFTYTVCLSVAAFFMFLKHLAFILCCNYIGISYPDLYLINYRKLQSASVVSPSVSPANRSPDSQSTSHTQVSIISVRVHIRLLRSIFCFS